MDEKTKEVRAKYRKEKTVSVTIAFYKNTEADLINKLSEQKNKSGYIKALIKNDINEGSDTNG